MSLLRKPSQNFTENTPGSHAASPPPRSTPCPSATPMLRRLLFGLCVGTPHSKGGWTEGEPPIRTPPPGPDRRTADCRPPRPPALPPSTLRILVIIFSEPRRIFPIIFAGRRTPNRRTADLRPPRTSGPRPPAPPEPTRRTSIFPRAPGLIPSGTKPAIKPAIYAGSTAPSKLLHRDMPSRETRLRRHGPTYLRTRSYGRTLIYTTTGRRGSSDLTLFGSPSVRCAICI